MIFTETAPPSPPPLIPYSFDARVVLLTLFGEHSSDIIAGKPPHLLTAFWCSSDRVQTLIFGISALIRCRGTDMDTHYIFHEKHDDTYSTNPREKKSVY